MLDYITWAANPDIISSPITVRWYGLMFAIGFIIGYEIVARIFKHEGAPERWLGILLIYVVIATIVGARLGHVFFYEWDVYSQNPIRILYIWEGGLASHGGTIAIIIAIILYSIFVTKRSPLWTFDRLVIAIALVGGLIRLGNLFNSEIFGTATTLPWGFMFVRSREWHMLYEGQAVHPTQIYEALCYFALFGLLMWMYWKKNAEERPGLIFGVFMIGIFLPRFLIEFIKNDQVAREATMSLNIGQQLSIPFILLGVGLIIYAMMRPKVHLTFPNRFADEKVTTKRR
ncbi:prolipoprotein diacylglyceryl transferase [Muribaculum intestinale]|jgi:prolipoprotein diacylglyceryl transferase|uniref:Phosphatidylglycerol--prolipoprotein diacylglyceryl transferase n=2 Tax=Muribaculum intestinale TaxID=1796646 RepID=A0A1B1S9J0_9BACT|nr:prolipoprotein diacylglyceryl transferase [Muribaculum intestinale]ROS81279.1 prolipoprotein diacylglyceryl transferase [Muribaculaceae bacterium Isolate-042 (Harlan)]ROT09494.1 prolipoprotein diacylglyceryl transferase [Muribaculaceae bacterium Isolate-100 (HZI)]RXE65307.1 prolipoprotein diacylglyceryl transferase [Muribaculaceae bacterium Isolate-007 (NCI)]GFI68177.1 prolipoprotein diacylglyceryl transferase [Muribaculaceae bacterium]ANU63448.1 prolipoprotein diacylglyceryl transferase [M